MDYGLKVSKDGSDVKTAADQDLLFISKNNTLKISQSRQDTVNNGATTTVAHGLGYTPYYMCWYNNSGWKPATNYESVQISADNTNITITNNSGAQRTFRTIIFIDQLV